MRGAFDRIASKARACRAVVDRALALPPIPDINTDAQYRHTMELQAKWADTMGDAATKVDLDDLDCAVALQREVARQGALIHPELRKVWPSEEPPSEKA